MDSISYKVPIMYICMYIFEGLKYKCITEGRDYRLNEKFAYSVQSNIRPE